jgi:phosphoglycerate dehydrogenase-like enzyme
MRTALDIDRPVHIVICDDIDDAFRSSGSLVDLEPAGRLDICNDCPKTPLEIRQRLAQAHIALLVRDRTVLGRDILQDLPNLRLIAATSGPHRIDIEAATELGIAVAITPPASSASIAEHVFALIFALTRDIVSCDRTLRGGSWNAQPGSEIEGKTLGILGLGRTGSAVAKRAAPFGLKVIAWGPTLTAERAAAAGATPTQLDELFRTSDIVSVHLRRSHRSRSFVDADRLAMMKRQAFLIDISWAGIVDRAALAATLNRGHLAGAGVDLCDVGPIEMSDPLLNAPRTILTPHVAWRTAESYQRLTSAVVADVLAYLGGNPVHVINPVALRHPRHTSLIFPNPPSLPN